MELLENIRSLPLSMGKEDIPVVPSGLFSIDYVSGGGYPCGGITEIYGEAGSGKTAIALRSIAEMQSKGKGCVFVDMEHSFPFGLAEASNVGMESLFVLSPSSGEEAFEMMDRLVRTEAVSLIVLDSISAILPKGDAGKRISEQSLSISSVISRCLPDFLPVLRSSGAVALFISQTRARKWGPPTRTAGGAAMRGMASLRIETSCGELLRSGGSVAGQEMFCLATKCLSAEPRRTASFDVLGGVGADSVRFFADVAERTGKLSFTENATVSFGGCEFQSYSDFRSFLHGVGRAAFDKISETIAKEGLLCGKL